MIKHIRVYGYKQTIWLAVPVVSCEKLKEDTILLIRDSKGTVEEVFASQVQIDTIHYR